MLLTQTRISLKRDIRGVQTQIIIIIIIIHNTRYVYQIARAADILPVRVLRTSQRVRRYKYICETIILFSPPHSAFVRTTCIHLYIKHVGTSRCYLFTYLSV